MSIKIKAKELKDTDKQIVTVYYQLLDGVRLNNPKITKTEAIEYAVIMTAKVYARSVLDQMEKYAPEPGDKQPN